MKRRLHQFVFILALLLVSQAAGAKVFFSKEGALKEAFPKADHFEEVNLFLSDADVEWIQKKSKVKVSTRVLRAYKAYTHNHLLGFAFVDTHRVRSMNETLLVQISPEGALERILLLAFHEPQEYQPSKNWLDQFKGKKISPQLRLRGEIDGISGATLTSNAVVASSRKLLTLYQRKLSTQSKILSMQNTPDTLAPAPQKVN